MLLSTLAACGDVERNVLCCPAPDPRRRPRRDAGRRRPLGRRTPPRGRRATGTSGSTARRSTTRSARRRARSRSRPPATTRSSRSTARPTSRASSRRPSPCPRTTAPTSTPTTWATSPSSRTGELVGYNVLVGGGLGTTPSAQKTFPFLAVPLCYVDRADVLEIGEAVIKVFRDFGNRSDRKRARLKYIIHDWGLPAFRAKVEEYLGHPLADPKPVAVTDVDDHLGWHEQGDGKLFLGIPVENGRIKDEGDVPAGQRPAGLLREVPDAGPADLPAVDPAGRPRPGLAARDRRAGWRSTGSPRSSRSRPSAAGRWPARRCRPAAWPSPRPSGPCRRSWTSSRPSSRRSAWTTSGSRCG